MPFIDYPSGLECYSRADIDQFFAGGAVTQISNRNAIPVKVASGSWTQETTAGHRAEDWYYADVAHGRGAQIAYVEAMKGADAWILPMAQSYQQEQDTNTVRIWIPQEPTYDVLCLVVYV